MNDVLTLAEVAAYLKLSEKTLQKMVKNQEIPCAKVGSQWRFSKTVIDDWLRAQMRVIPQNDLSRLIEDEYDFVPLSRLFGEDSLIHDLKAGQNWRSLKKWGPWLRGFS
jgi:PTS system nitrogen regulatory IIA component